MNATAERSILVIQGEHAVSNDMHTMITTLLGSCVAACLWDPTRNVGGLNHIVLSPRADLSPSSNYAGVNAMELLINDLIKNGADRRALQAKVFGGSRMVAGLSDIGERNAEFVKDFLGQENIPILGGSTGGTSARKIQFWPTSGRARQMLVGNTVIEEVVIPVAKKPVVEDDIELF